MNLLIVLNPSEQDWVEHITDRIEKIGGEHKIATVGSVQKAVELLRGDVHFDDVIHGTFGSGREYLHAPWREIQRVATEAGTHITVLTSVGFGISEQDVKTLAKEGVGVLDKLNFTEQMKKFVAERSQPGGPKEIR